MGLDISLYNGEAKIEEIPSEKYPEHYCNKAYLRSSYNESGFNRVVSNLIGKDLYFIFEPGGEYEIPLKGKADKCLERAVDVLDSLKAIERPLRVTTVSHNIFSGISKYNTEGALRITKETIAANKSGSFGSKDGDFYLDEPLKIIAAIPGVSILGTPCTHLVYESDISWYIQMSEIVIEFIEYAKSLENPVLHWSS